uniref:DNA-directed RNA polymerase III subunit n=1 Tax=Plectus sambesii TaxID=2011161 RepID=A0A914UZM9_9BILA
MSRGGRGGGGRGGSGVRAIADALGIQRQDLASYSVSLKEPPPLFPPLSRKPLPLRLTDDLRYMADVKQELINRFYESPFYLQPSSTNGDIARYTDKYRAIQKEKWTPQWDRLPSEICWKRKIKPKAADKPAVPVKKRKLVKSPEKGAIDAKLAKLEENEKNGKATLSESDDEKGEEEEDEEKRPNVDEEPPSDDDYLEEGNDYIETYFDNGEDYGEGGSDDNLEDDGGVYS